MKIFPGLKKGEVCIKLHEEELTALLITVRHFKTIVPGSVGVLADFIQQSENLIAKTTVREYVSEEFREEDQPKEMRELPKT